MTGSFLAAASGSIEYDEWHCIEQAQRDPQAFANLYRRYLNPVYRYITARVGDPQDAEDLTSQVFLAVLEGLHGYHHQGHFAAWLFSIARRKVADYYRRKPPELSYDPLTEIPAPITDPLKAYILDDDLKQIARIFQELGEEERELIRLRFAAGLNFKEMSLLLNRKESTIKMALYRLLERIEHQLEKEYGR